jgi:hypothetical protein
MKNLIFFLFLLAAVNSSFSQPVIQSYDINLKLDAANNKLDVSNIVTLDARNTQSFELLFNYDCKIKSINIIKESGRVPLNYKFKGKDTLQITLEDAGNYGLVNIGFEYTYPVENDSVVLLDRGNRWYPLIADNIVTFKLSIESPEGYYAVSAGKLLNESVTSGISKCTYKSSVPVFKLPVFIAKKELYKMKSSVCGDVIIYSYILSPNDSLNLDSLNNHICGLINYFNENIGKYSFDRFNLIETSLYQGANLGSSFITAGTENIKAFEKGYIEWLNLAAAAQWIAAGVFPRLFCKGFWFLSLSLPHYLRLMYAKDTQGEDAFNKEIEHDKLTFEKIEGTENEVTVLDVDYPNTKEKGILIYAKGVLILDKIKNLLGETNWRNLIKDFYKQFDGRIILLDDFVNIIDKYDSKGEVSKTLLKLLSEKGSVN